MMIRIMKWLSIFFITSNTFLIAEKLQNRTLIGTNPLNIIDKSFYIHYGMMKKEKKEIIIPLFFRKEHKDMLVFGSGIDYRWYKNTNGDGLYRGIGINFSLVNWDYQSDSLRENIWKILLYPRVEYGYRFFLYGKISIVPHLLFDYQIGKVKTSDGEQRLERSNSNFALMVGLHIDYTF